MIALMAYFPDAPPTPSGLGMPSALDPNPHIELQEANRDRAGSMNSSSPGSPSPAAPAPRKWRQEISALMKNPRFLLLAATFGFTFGTFNGWMAIISLLLNPLGFSVDATSALGLLMEVLGVVLGVLIGELGDRVESLKWLFWILLVMASTALLFFSLLIENVFSRSADGTGVLTGSEYQAAFAMCLIGGVIM